MIMKCGCSCNSVIHREGSIKPGCVVHGCTEPMEPQPDLSKRMSMCSYGDESRASSEKLAFFKYRPEERFDEHFCGCRTFD